MDCKQIGPLGQPEWWHYDREDGVIRSSNSSRSGNSADATGSLLHILAERSVAKCLGPDTQVLTLRKRYNRV
ncbi:hypothetical protein J6590_033492 [Homalodisca vitripennis]|nr:hypothetical protein J6590_033492 [Homalodisca vitripennis]